MTRKELQDWLDRYPADTIVQALVHLGYDDIQMLDLDSSDEYCFRYDKDNGILEIVGSEDYSR